MWLSRKEIRALRLAAGWITHAPTQCLCNFDNKITTTISNNNFVEFVISCVF